MNLIILVICVVSLFLLYKMAGGLVARFLPDTWPFRLLAKAVGLALGFTYIYFAGYYVMDKDASVPLSWVVALVPVAVFVGIQIKSRASVLEAE